MAHQHVTPIVVPLGQRRVGLDPTPNRFALHLDCGIWRASCTGCGYEQRVERKAARRDCPVCVEVA
jgi:hypothetical protein